MEVELHSVGASKAIYANPPDWPEMVIWRERLRPGDLFIDVGANAGVYSVWAADCGASVIAVEPLQLERLRRNIELNPSFEIEVVGAAASNVTGELHFDPAFDADGHISADGPLTVPSILLDTVIGDRMVAGVKIDVEGAERLVLEGMPKALSEHRVACIQLEWNDQSRNFFDEGREAAAGVLRSHGYQLFRPDAAGHLLPTDATIGPDVFALPRRPGA